MLFHDKSARCRRVFIPHPTIQQRQSECGSLASDEYPSDVIFSKFSIENFVKFITKVHTGRKQKMYYKETHFYWTIIDVPINFKH